MITPTLINLTGHTVHLHNPDGVVVTIEPRGNARVQEWRSFPATVEYNGKDTVGLRIETKEVLIGSVTGLPPYDSKANNVYIVSWAVALTLIADGDERGDIVVLDEKVQQDGKTRGARALAYIHMKNK